MQEIILAAVLLTGMALAAAAVGAAPEEMVRVAPGELRMLLDPGATPVERRAAALFAAEVERRTGAGLTDAEGARFSLVVGTPEAGALRGRPAAAWLGADGYALSLTPDAQGRLFVVWQSPSGVVAGVWKLLRLLRYEKGAIRIPTLAVKETPKLPVRGIYFATHFENFYHVAPLEEVDRVIEEFALWGGNSLSVWFDMHHFTGFDDPAAQAHLARLRHFAETARGVGMHFGLTFLANEAYKSSPEALRAKWLPGWPHYHVEVCPSKPEGLALIGKWQAQVIDAFPAVDFIWMWPYDQGGCACEECKPWGANGFLRASEQLSRLYHRRFAKGKAWLSTWCFDSLSGTTGEYDGLLRLLREKQPDWIDGILTGTHGDSLPHPLRDLPERYPLTSFPEISMYRMGPWGGCGANPLPEFNARLAADARGRTQGGWPYSEGIYEDLNKFIWAQVHASPEREVDDILREYASHYLGPDLAGDGVRLFHLLEKTHARHNWRVYNLEEADAAWDLAQSLDARLPAWAKTSWRWRLLYVRAQIDHVLKHQGYQTPEAQEALRPLCDEIVRIYHAEKSFIRPAPFPKPRETKSLAHGRPVAASSTNPVCPGSERMLTDGVWAQDDPENYWAHDPAKGKTAQLVVDLGESKAIKEVHLQFRGLYGVFWFVPSKATFAVSEDGKEYRPVTTTEDLPKEGNPYSAEFRKYAMDAKGRYVRLELGPSQHTGEPFPGVLELTEIEVLGP